MLAQLASEASFGFEPHHSGLGGQGDRSSRRPTHSLSARPLGVKLLATILQGGPAAQAAPVSSSTETHMLARYLRDRPTNITLTFSFLITSLHLCSSPFFLHRRQRQRICSPIHCNITSRQQDPLRTNLYRRQTSAGSSTDHDPSHGLRHLITHTIIAS